jgi:hypothetical protein
MAQSAPMPMCPMARTCMGMMERPITRVMMVIPGIAFISLGVLIVAWPSVLPWLVAAAFIVSGGAMLLMANFMRGVGARLKQAGG